MSNYIYLPRNYLGQLSLMGEVGKSRNSKQHFMDKYIENIFHRINWKIKLSYFLQKAVSYCDSRASPCRNCLPFTVFMFLWFTSHILSTGWSNHWHQQFLCAHPSAGAKRLVFKKAKEWSSRQMHTGIKGEISSSVTKCISDLRF